jgi:acyl-CoA thioesterase-1
VRATLLACSLAPALAALALLGCGGREVEPPAAEPERAPPASAGPQTGGTERAEGGEGPRPDLAAGPETGLPTVVFLGDSLTAGFGLAAEEAYPALVERLLAERALPVRVVNAGVSGDTSAGGLARLDWLLAQRPAIVFVCLGGNDGLRGIPPEATEANLRAIVERARAAGARVVLAGMQIPPNYGPEATARFRALFPRLARDYDLPFVPFLLEGVAAEPALNLPDGIHPNSRGQAIVAETVARALEPLVRAARAG